MPRTKKIESKNNNINLSGITIETIKDNNCLSIELYISDLDERMWYLIKSFYRFKVIGENEGFSMKLNNSWKGLIQLLLSVLYCKVGGKIVVLQTQADYHFVHHVRIDHDFELLESANIPNNPIIERLYTPPSYRPMYIRSNYTNKNVFQTLMALCVILKIDTKKSNVSINKSDIRDKNYNSKQIKDRIDISNLVCNILPPSSNEGVAFVTKDTFKSLLERYRILIAHPIKKPQDMKKYNEEEWDCTYPYKYLAYPVLKRYENLLVKYFPLCKESITKYAQKTDKLEYGLSWESSFLEIGCDYVITDFEYLGKWG